MKKLSDYKDEEAFELWARLLEPFIEILSDADVRAMIQEKNPPIVTAKAIIEGHAKAAKEILLAIDDTPVDGLNIVVRLVEVLKEIGNDPTIRSFFGFVAEEKKSKSSFGSATENTEAGRDTSSDT